MTITKKISEDFAGSGFAELEFRMSGFSTSRKPLEQNTALLLPQLGSANNPETHLNVAFPHPDTPAQQDCSTKSWGYRPLRAPLIFISTYKGSPTPELQEF